MDWGPHTGARLGTIGISNSFDFYIPITPYPFVLPQAGSCRRGSPGSGPNQLKAGRASPAARQYRAKTQGFSLTYTQIGR